ncbi:hypothetical protein F4809DRAFT_658896 [Biscogniauxia mediterranea]|nr:hypothetical protein F4809DRAFT_658896 [Biscogniauxia mediterranea]
MPSQRLSTSREQIPPYSSFPPESDTPGSPPPPYTEEDHRRAPRHFIPQDPRDGVSPPPPWPMTVPIIVITQADARCAFKLCDRHTTGASNYCRKHKCRAKSCPSYKEIGGDSLYCSRHGCRWPGCDARADGTARFCQIHKCQQASCPAARLSSTEKSFCAFHACRQQGCSRSREEGWSEFCRKHVCQARGCPRGAAASSALCKRHQCDIQGCRAVRPLHASCCSRHQCEVGDCQEAQVDGSRYCRSHKCASDGCAVVRRRGLRHCAAHKDQPSSSHEQQSVSVSVSSGLRNEGIYSPRSGVVEIRDNAHHHHHHHPPGQLRYLRPRKNNMPVRHSSSSSYGYCRAHACAAEEEEEACARPVSGGAYYYCAHHECRPCPNPRFWTDGGRGALREHAACEWREGEGKGEGLQPCGNPNPRRGGWTTRYCEAHACAESGCEAPRTPAGVYCADHACRGSVACPRRAGRGSPYCARHKCNQAGCGLERVLHQPSCEKHRYSCEMSPFYAVSGHRRFVVPLR